MKLRIIFSISLCLMILAGILLAPQEARLLRFPTIHKDQIVFTYAGDLYLVSSLGGVARKLTSHEGFELFARFSPDGSKIAFTGEYDGNREVYLMSPEGGIPQRLTYTASLGRDDVTDRMGPNNIVMGWKQDNKHIVFRSRLREWNSFNGQLYLASVDGGMPQQLPLPRGGFCSFSPDDKKLAYNRIFREFRTWKRYRGGMADDVWVYDFETKNIENVTNNPAQDIIPMWHGNKIYFLSDRDENKRMNLYVYDTGTKETKKLTAFTAFDIKFPSLGPEALVFENGGEIYRFNLAQEKATKVPIIIADDMISARDQIVKVSENVTNYEISPDGKRALFGARGEIFTVPAKHGNTRNLTNTSGVHERDSKWSPDGKWIAYVSDASGTDEIYIMPQDNPSEAQQVTKNGDTYKYQIYWSPDSKKLVWGDKKLRLNYVDIETKEIVEVIKAKAWEIRDYSWSPDSQWIAYSKIEAESMSKMYLYALQTKKNHEITEGWYSSYSPSFDSEGRYLFFVSDRDFNPIFSRTEWNHAYQAMARVYLVTLLADVKSPFEPKSDEVEPKNESDGEGEKVGEEKKKAEEKKEKQEKKKEVKLKVDLQDLKSRIIGLPIEVAYYQHITSAGDKLYYMKRKDRERKSSLKMYDLKEQKETDLGQIDGYEISADKKKMLVSKDKSYAIIDFPQAEIKIKDKLDLSGMEMKLERKKEWSQIFNECWRQMRDFFYDPGMHGVDWDEMQKRYEPLAKSVNHRADLTYVIGEMIGELNVGHTYVGGGDLPKVKKIKVGLLGAQFKKDPETGYYQITKILKGENWDESLRSPLTEVGVNVKEGDYLLAIDRKPTNDMIDLYEALLNTVGKQVTLKVNTKPQEKGSREVVVQPIEDELPLYYYNMVQTNIEKVTQATDGKVGYIHIPNMGQPGLNEFVKHFYPQLRKKALIIDVRSNGGGNVSPMIIDRLRREIAIVGVARNTIPVPDPYEAFLGPMVCLMDEFSASDGDIFPYRFQKHKLGKTIGKRSWGGVVGYRDTLPLLDGGFLYKPEFATYGAGKEGWIIEGYGVEPDIYVGNDPAKEYAGIDEQLNKAIEVLLEELKTKEKKLPPVPRYPKKDK